MASELRICPDAAAVAHALAELFVSSAKEAIAQRDRFVVALSGGRTPKAAYELLGQPPFSNALDWSRVVVFFGDERCVPPDDDQSNYKMANEAFLRVVGIPQANVHRVHGEDDPQVAARAYREELIATLGEHPVFDLVLLGMGEDGHTASLFPGTDPREGNDELVRPVYSEAHGQWRITLTPKVINAARKIVFTVEGAAKAKVLAQVREGPKDPLRFPSQIIAPENGTLIWLVDRAAAGDSDNRS